MKMKTGGLSFKLYNKFNYLYSILPFYKKCLTSPANSGSMAFF